MTLTKNTQGFSLIEVVIASALFALAFTAGLKLYQQIHGQWQQLVVIQQAQHQLDSAQTDIQKNLDTEEYLYPLLSPTAFPVTSSSKTLLSSLNTVNTTNSKTSIEVAYLEKDNKKTGVEVTRLASALKAITLTQDIEVIAKLGKENDSAKTGDFAEQLTFTTAPPYQSHWQDIQHFGNLTTITPMP
ncbi:type II secretion system protein [Alteromonas sp. 1_MG-2023]|uniref:PulJ/GspJ family protein n=1 Tax=Alteromonas sp. 1_MG-2023 TaxID=3062669 RepID=UPI0026E48F1D|nr:type II secretion system protein [Alteromonas sp. 1_MG-2023]MDO6566203.1 type II secretion system protein [Alteromonas sp. 1_MG-2023]